jgi:3,4-dihydroxy-2-butanone 4-phosphate synthase
MARLPDLLRFALRHSLRIGSIESLIAWRKAERPPKAGAEPESLS